MTLEEHTLELGKLQINFHSLELLLRLFLTETNGEEIKIPTIGQTSIELTHLTNYDSLGQLITKYNNLTNKTPNFQIDPLIVNIRDAIAHGRLISLIEAPPLRLFKFDKPKDGLVNLTFDETLDRSWFDKSRAYLFKQIEKIQKCARTRGLKSIP